MLRRTSSSPPSRQGVVLLVVLVMLTLFAAVGVAFVTFSETQANSAGIYLKTETDDRPNPDLLFSFVMNQLVYDTSRSDSSLQTHGLLTGVYGTSGNTPFNGLGRLHSTTGLDAATLLNFQGRTYSELTHGSLNAPYTYTDYNNAWLGTLQYDPANVQGLVRERSFVRAARSVPGVGFPGVFNPYAPANYGFWQPPNAATPFFRLDTTPFLGGDLSFDERRSVSMRPGPWDHPNFPPPDDFGGDVKNLPPGFRTPVALALTTLMAQNDSYWVDVGFPIITDSTGRRFKPLAAFFITDLDSRINLNVHGNTQMYVDAGGNQYLNGHASNQGWGAHEVNASRVLALNEWQNLFLGMPNSASSERGRYGRRDALVAPVPVGMAVTPGLGGQFVPGVYSRPRWFSQVDYDGRFNPQLPLPPINQVTTAGPTMNRSGTLAQPLNPFGFAFPLFTPGFENNQALELLNHPMLAPIMFPYPAGPLGRSADRTFADAHLEAILRHGDTGTDGLQSDLRRCLPLSVNEPLYRLLMTTRSYDLVRPGKMPYLHRPNPPAGPTAYLARPADYGVGPNAEEFTVGSRLAFPPDMPGSPLAPPGLPTPPAPLPPYAPAQGTEYYNYQGPLIGNQFTAWHANNGHQRLNVNRYLRPYPHLGSGIDPTGVDYSPTPIFDLTTAARRVNPMQYPAAAVVRNQYRLAQIDRQQLARDIYIKLLGITGAQVPATIPAAIDPPPVQEAFLKQLEPLRHLAQLAVNLVDYLDEDDINTPFNFYTLVDASATPDRYNPGQLVNPAETDATRQVPMYWVFGTELPRVVVNEVLTEAQVPSGAGTFEVKVWAELHNTTMVRAAAPPPPAAYQPVTRAPAGGQVEDELAISLFVPTTPGTPDGTGYAPYQVVVGVTNPGIGMSVLTNPMMGAPLENFLGNANVTGIPFTPRFATHPVNSAALGNVGMDFSTYAGNPSDNQPRYTSTSVASGLVGNRAGSRQYMESLATRTGPPYPQNQIDGFFLIGPATLDAPPPMPPTTYTADARDTIHPAGVTPPAPASNFLIPLSKANSMPFLNTLSANRGVGAPFMSYTVTKPGAAVNWDAAHEMDRQHGLTVVLRRLANPYLPPQTDPTVADYNPYITIDYMAGVPINNLGATFSPAAKETSGNPIQSRGKKQPYTSFIAMRDPQIPVMNSSMTQHSLGSPNFAGAGFAAFDWLQHLDRQAASPMELLGVSGYRPHELTQRFMDYPVVYTDPAAPPTTGAMTLTLTGNADDMRYRGNYRFDWTGATVQVGIGPDAEYPVTVTSAAGNTLNLGGALVRGHPAGTPVFVFATTTTAGTISLTPSQPLRFNHRAPFLDPLTGATTPRTNRLHRLFDFIETRTDSAAGGNPQIILQNQANVPAAGFRTPTLNAAAGSTLFGRTSSGETWRIQPGTTLRFIPSGALAGEQAEVVTVLAVNPVLNTYTARFLYPHDVNSLIVANFVPPRVLVPILGSAVLPVVAPTLPYQARTRLELSLLHGNCGDGTAHWEIGVGTTLTVFYGGGFEAQAIVENVTSLPSGNFACDLLLPLPAVAPAPTPPQPVPPLPAGTGAIIYAAVAPSTNRVPGKINLNTMAQAEVFRAMCDAQFCNEFNPIIVAPGLYANPAGYAISPTQITLPVATFPVFSRPVPTAAPWTDSVSGVAWSLTVGTKLELTDPVNGRITVRIVNITPAPPAPGPYTIDFVDDRTGLPLSALTPPWIPTTLNTAVTVDNVTMMYDRMLMSRDGADPDGIPNSGDEIPSRPFQGYSAGFTAPTLPATQSQFPNGLGIADTFLRADPFDTNRRLFEVPNATHSQKANELLSKIGNHLTSRSNVFAVWVTIGYFEVGPDITLATPVGPLTPIPAGAANPTINVSSTFGLRAGQFLVVDRGVYDPGPGLPTPPTPVQEIVRIQTVVNGNTLILDRTHTPAPMRFAHPYNPPAATPDRIMAVKLESGLMPEVSRTEGKFKRHRFFAIVDRSVLDPWILHNRVGDIRAVLGNAALDPRKQSNTIIATLPVQPNVAPGLRIVAAPASAIAQLQLGSRVIVDSGKSNEEVVSVLAVDPIANTFTAAFSQAHLMGVVGNPTTLGFPDVPPPVVHWSVIE